LLAGLEAGDSGIRRRIVAFISRRSAQFRAHPWSHFTFGDFRMNYNILGSGEMLSISEAWTYEHETVFKSIEEIRPLWKKVKAAHEQLTGAWQAASGNEPVSRLTRQLAEADRRFDGVARAIHGTLDSAATYLEVQDPARTEEAQRIRRALERVFPEGLSIVLRAYREEAGYTATLVASLDEELRQVLRSVPLLHATVLDAVLLWNEFGKRLSALESERSILLANQPDPPTEKKARSDWLKVVKLVLSNQETVEGQQEAVIAIRQPLLDAIEVAVARAARRTANAEKAGGDDDSAAAPVSAEATST
jgi:hypothetical protein